MLDAKSSGQADVFRGRSRHVQARVLTENVTAMVGDRLPAQTLVSVSRLAIDPMLFEVEAIVVLE